MKFPLNHHLLSFLLERKYFYLLSKTETVFKEDIYVNITLKPTRKKPALHMLPLNFDTYFEIYEEPVIMALGIDETLISVDLSLEDTLLFKHALLRKY